MLTIAPRGVVRGATVRGIDVARPWREPALGQILLALGKQGVLRLPDQHLDLGTLKGRIPVSCGSWAVYLRPADKSHKLIRPTVSRAKRPSREGSHGLPAALSPLVTPSTPAVSTHVIQSGHLPVSLPTPLRAHTPAGGGHGGTRKSHSSRRVQI
jgi:hypothetical protein